MGGAIGNIHWIIIHRVENDVATTTRTVAFGDPAQLDDALGNQIHVLFDCFVDLIEQFMQSDEIRAFHIPMRLLHLQLQDQSLRPAADS